MHLEGQPNRISNPTRTQKRKLRETPAAPYRGILPPDRQQFGGEAKPSKKLNPPPAGDVLGPKDPFFLQGKNFFIGKAKPGKNGRRSPAKMKAQLKPDPNRKRAATCPLRSGPPPLSGTTSQSGGGPPLRFPVAVAIFRPAPPGQAAITRPGRQPGASVKGSRPLSSNTAHPLTDGLQIATAPLCPLGIWRPIQPT